MSSKTILQLIIASTIFFSGLAITTAENLALIDCTKTSQISADVKECKKEISDAFYDSWIPRTLGTFGFDLFLIVTYFIAKKKEEREFLEQKEYREDHSKKTLPKGWGKEHQETS